MKRKIAIVGGGMAGLAAAFDLARTNALRQQFEVTIYQMGWRLGGKLASGRDEDGRTVEHGLHILFGFYENAFELIRAAYAQWNPLPNQAIKTFAQAFEARERTAMGTKARGGPFLLDWPPAEGEPGLGSVPLELWACIRQVVRVLEWQYERLHHPTAGNPEPVAFDQAISALLAEAIPWIFDRAGAEPLARGRLLAGSPFVETFNGSLKIAEAWANALASRPPLRSERHLRGYVRQLRKIAESLTTSKKFVDPPANKFLAQLIDVGTALIKGVVLDMELGGASVVELDRLDFREWLAGQGAAWDAVYRSSIVHSLYDTALQYVEGDTRRPSFGAGSAAQVSLRSFGSYRGAFAYEANAGSGEAIIAPIYRFLRQRGVRFQFFHKLTGIALTAEGDAVASLNFDKQVQIDGAEYEPTMPPDPRYGNLEYWPQTPRWDKIVCGKDLEGLDLESYWRPHKGEAITLHRGACFDDVVLAIPVGAFKPLNDAPGPCEALIRANPRFAKMTEAATLTPTIAVQAWSTRTLAQLGWPPTTLKIPAHESAAIPTSTGPPPLGIWSDRSVVLAYEGWRSERTRPTTLHYFCDIFECELYRAPPDRKHTQEEADRRAVQAAIRWFETGAGELWPGAVGGAGFDWRALFDRRSREGRLRIKDQIVKANIDPSACCAGSPAGSTQWRLPADGSGFRNLFLAGAWIDTGFNAECVEAAVISGRQAARAISGCGQRIVGEDFLRFERCLGLRIVETVFDLAGAAIAEIDAVSARGDRPPAPRGSPLRRTTGQRQ